MFRFRSSEGSRGGQQSRILRMLSLEMFVKSRVGVCILCLAALAPERKKIDEQFREEF